jgi:putative PIN family toxin of toxin-antitoxin system
MIFLQATISETGPAAALLRLVDEGAVFLFLSREILDEVREVLSRPKLRYRNPDLTDERLDALIIRVSDKATIVNGVAQHFTFARDPKDEKYINLAVEVEAEYLVSRDNDLLDLMTGYAEECKEFRRRFRPLKVIAPVEFLKTFAPKKTNGN